MADEKKGPSDEQAAENTSAPEVEAEIVREDADGSSAGDGDGETEAAPSPDETTAAPAGRAGRSAFTPGVVLFLAFAAVALIAFALWRFQDGDAPAGDERAPPAEEETAPAEPPEEKSGAGDEPSPDGETAAAPAAARETPASKIANGAAAARGADRDVDPVLDVPTADESDPPSLPDEDPAAGAVPEFEFEDEAAPREAGSDSSSGAAPADPTAAAAAGKIENADIAALKETLLAETQSLADALAEERRRTAALSEEIAALRRDFEAALAARNERASTEIADLRAEIDKIRNGDDLTASRRAAAAAALDALEGAVERGRSFASELHVLERLAPDETQLAALRRHAQEGAPRLDALKESFADAARKGLAAAGRESAGEGFFARLGARARGLVSVRPAQPQSGPGPRAVMSRAEAAVEDGDLAAALAELEALPAAAREAMAEWTQKARAREEVERAIAALKGRFLTPPEESPS